MASKSASAAAMHGNMASPETSLQDAWVLGLGTTNHVNGHNSYRPNSQPLEIYSPYFGDNAHSLMQLVTA